MWGRFIAACGVTWTWKSWGWARGCREQCHGSHQMRRNQTIRKNLMSCFCLQARWESFIQAGRPSWWWSCNSLRVRGRLCSPEGFQSSYGEYLVQCVCCQGGEETVRGSWVLQAHCLRSGIMLDQAGGHFDLLQHRRFSERPCWWTISSSFFNVDPNQCGLRS